MSGQPEEGAPKCPYSCMPVLCGIEVRVCGTETLPVPSLQVLYLTETCLCMTSGQTPKVGSEIDDPVEMHGQRKTKT